MQVHEQQSKMKPGKFCNMSPQCDESTDKFLPLMMVDDKLGRGEDEW